MEEVGSKNSESGILSAGEERFIFCTEFRKIIIRTIVTYYWLPSHQAKSTVQQPALHPSLVRWPDVFMQLELQSDVEMVVQDPFSQLSQLKPVENCSHKYCTVFGQVVAAKEVSGPFVILP